MAMSEVYQFLNDFKVLQRASHLRHEDMTNIVRLINSK